MAAGPISHDELYQAAIGSPVLFELDPADAVGLIEAGNGDALILTQAEADLYYSARGAEEERVDVDATIVAEALERLGRLRVRRAEELSRTLADATPLELADAARRLLGHALEVEAVHPIGGGRELEGYVNAYLALRHAAGGQVKDELGDARRRIDRLEAAARAVLVQGEALGGDTFEGRLEALGLELATLERVVTLGELA